MGKRGSKRTRLLALSTLLFMVFMMSLREIGAQGSIFEYLEQALSKVIATSSIMNLTHYDYVANNSLFGVYLSEGGSHSLMMEFSANVDYLILGGGDDDILDLDLAVLSSSGNVLREDSESDASPVLQFRPNYTQTLTLRITNYSSVRPGFCVMVILKKTVSSNFSMYQIAQALENAIDVSRTVRSLVSGRFATGAFCLFGGKLQKDADTSIYNTQLPPGQYALIGAGSDNVRDVDIFVLKQTGRDDYGVEVTKDTEVDNTPICTFTVRSGYYRLKHKNYDSTGPGFVFSVLLRF